MQGRCRNRYCTSTFCPAWLLQRVRLVDCRLNRSKLILTTCHRNFTQFYSTKSDRDLNLRKEYDNQMDYRKHLQAFIDRWRYNANRGKHRPTRHISISVLIIIHNSAAQAQSRIKILEKASILFCSISRAAWLWFHKPVTWSRSTRGWWNGKFQVSRIWFPSL